MAHRDYPSRTPYSARGYLSRGRPDARGTLTAILRLRAAEQGDDLAYAFLADGESIKDQLTYADLDRRAARIGGALRARGACGRPVLLLYPPGLDYVAAFFGCVYAGAI